MEQIDWPDKRITKLYFVDWCDGPLAGVFAVGEPSAKGQSSELGFETIAIRYMEGSTDLNLAKAWPVPSGCIDRLREDPTNSFADAYYQAHGPKQQTVHFRERFQVEPYSRSGGFFQEAALWRPPRPMLWVLYESSQSILRVWNVSANQELGVNEMRDCLFGEASDE